VVNPSSEERLAPRRWNLEPMMFRLCVLCSASIAIGAVPVAGQHQAAEPASSATQAQSSVTRGTLALGISANDVHTWPYGSANQFTRDWFDIGAFVGWSDGP
jgi:hypothetical protein